MPTTASPSAREEFAKLLGPKTAAVLGRPWAEIAAALKLDRARRRGECACRAQHLERHRRALAGRRCGPAFADRDVGPAGVRPRPPVRRLSRLRHLPRRRPPRRAGTAPGAGRTRAGRGRRGSAGEQCAGISGPGRRAAGAQFRRAQRLRGTRARTQRPAQGQRGQKRGRAGRSTARARRQPCRRSARRRAHATAMPPAISRKGGPFSTGCRSASWSIGSTR